MIDLSGYSIGDARDDFEFVDGGRRDFRVQRGSAQAIIDGVTWHGTVTISSVHGCLLTIDTPRGYIRVTAADVFPGLRDALSREYASRNAVPIHAQAMRDTLAAIVSLQSVVRLLASEHWSAPMAKRVNELNTRVALLRGTLEQVNEPSPTPSPSDSPGA
jgi:hypothetical protein